LILVAYILFLLPLTVVLAQQPPSPTNDNQSPFLSLQPIIPDNFQFGEKLPDFEARDINGRIWRFEDLQGKFTLVYIWDTFEARAADKLNSHGRETVRGLPNLLEIQRFFSKQKIGSNIQVLTFCRDYDYTHAHDYMLEKQYYFPVIADWRLVNKLFPNVVQDYQLVINPEGRLSNSFRSWSLGRVLFELERIGDTVTHSKTVTGP
jgi:hypothetical protein